MAKTKRNPFQIERDRQTIARLTLRGVTQAEIAKRLKMTQPMVAYDLAAVRKEWQAREANALAEARAVTMAQLDELQRTYWTSFARSKTRRRAAGDPRFLAGVSSCIERRCRLLGLDTPSVYACVTASTQSIPVIPQSDLEALELVYGHEAAQEAIAIHSHTRQPAEAKNGSIDPEAIKPKPKLAW